jgi:uncharacterized membrane protein
MPFESGKKLGLIASSINILVPPLIVVAVIAYYAILFSSYVGNPAVSYSAQWVFLSLVLFSGVLALLGYILFLVAMHNLSKYYDEPIIFKNLLRALIIQVIIAVIIVVTVLAFFIVTNTSLSTPDAYFIWKILGFLVIFLSVSIYCALLYKRAFDKLAEKSGEENFKTAGRLYLIGTALAIILIGIIIVWIAWIFAAMGYRKLAPTSAATAPYTYPAYQTQPPLPATKRCSNCSAENIPTATYCRNCGRQL